MRKTYCDACLEEADNYLQTFEPLCHIVEMAEGKGHGYVTMKGDPTSGRKEHLDLCTPCYNEVFTAAYKKVQEIRSKRR